jgi:ABC-type phosphate transport system substrate-binding protein
MRAGRRTFLAAAGALLTFMATIAPGMLGENRALAATAINGGGSSFAALEIQQWESAVAREPYNLSVNYTSNSSGAGRINYANGLYDFGASDVIYNVPEDGQQAVNEAETQHPFKYVTVSAGGLAFMYNLTTPSGTQVNDLKLTRNEVCQIFTGELSMWNNPELVATDPWLAGYDDPIKAITRSDSAGESYVLSQYCLAVDPGDWDTFVNYTDAHAASEPEPYTDKNMAAHQPVSYWPSQLIGGTNELQASGADAVADSVQDPTTGQFGITYVAAAYADVRSFPMASVQNAANTYTQPTPTAVNVALSYAVPNTLGTFNLNFTGTNPAAYFPSTYSYVIAPDHTESNFPIGKGETLSQFLCYSVGIGQKDYAASLDYAPLAQAVVNLSVSAIEDIPGAPPAKDCGTGGNAPIVPPSGGSTTTTSPSGGSATTTTLAPPSNSGTGTSTTTTSTPGHHKGKKGGKAGAGSTTPTTSKSAFSGEPGQPAGGTSSATASSRGTTATVQDAASTNPAAVTNWEMWEWLLIGAVVCGGVLVVAQLGRRAM